jgi:hypothetical protein
MRSETYELHKQSDEIWHVGFEYSSGSQWKLISCKRKERRGKTTPNLNDWMPLMRPGMGVFICKCELR